MKSSGLGSLMSFPFDERISTFHIMGIGLSWPARWTLRSALTSSNMRCLTTPLVKSSWPLFAHRLVVEAAKFFGVKESLTRRSLFLAQLAESEWTLLSSQRSKDRIQLFHRFWALKESYIKATGIGLVEDLKCLEFVPDLATLCAEHVSVPCNLKPLVSKIIDLILCCGYR